MRETLLRDIEMEYEARRMQNRAEETHRLAQATSMDPAIGQLTAQRLSLFRRRAQAAFAQPGEAMAIGAALHEEMAALQENLRTRLSQAGFSPDYLQPVYQCAACQDTGYVGEPIRQRCACFEARIRTRMLGEAGHGLNPAESFASYDETVYATSPLRETPEDTQRALMSRLRKRCEDYANAFPTTPQRNILMVGMSGLGKTYLMNCIGNHVRARGIEALKVTAYQLTERMRAAVFSHDPYAFSMLLEVPLLLLDDLGAEPVIRNITIEQLFTLLNERHLRGLHTVVSTNLLPDELKERYSERVFSRLVDRQNTLLLNFLGADVRLR
jgi:DNA replication protein